jgi:tRNA threonylcarbamoyladenosine biosynthesis protein TsaE
MHPEVDLCVLRSLGENGKSVELPIREASGEERFCIDFMANFRFPMAMTQRADSPEAMENLGRHAALSAKPCQVIALVGGLGAGKTHWTKGFVAEMGSHAEVTSPTFGLVHEYSDARLPIFHFDFYRLQSAEELIALGWDEYLEQEGVIIAEWGDQFPDLLPPETEWHFFSVEPDGSRTVRALSRPH